MLEGSERLLARIPRGLEGSGRFLAKIPGIKFIHVSIILKNIFFLSTFLFKKSVNVLLNLQNLTGQ